MNVLLKNREHRTCFAKNNRSVRMNFQRHWPFLYIFDLPDYKLNELWIMMTQQLWSKYCIYQWGGRGEVRVTDHSVIIGILFGSFFRCHHRTDFFATQVEETISLYIIISGLIIVWKTPIIISLYIIISKLIILWKTPIIIFGLLKNFLFKHTTVRS